MAKATFLNGILTLPSGQRISQQDPNFATFARQAGIDPNFSSTPQTQASQPSSFPALADLASPNQTGLTQEAKLNEGEFRAIRQQLGVGESNFDQFFTRSGEDIFLRGGLDVNTLERRLGPNEFDLLRNKIGVSPENFDEFFTRRGDDIFLKPGIAPGKVPDTVGVDELATATGFDLNSLARPGSKTLSTEQVLEISQNTLTGIEKQIAELRNQKQQELEAEKQALEDDKIQGLEDRISGAFDEGAPTRSSVRGAVFDRFKIDEKIDLLTTLQNKIASEQTMAQLGVSQELDRFAPTSIITRRQAKIERESAIRIAGYAAYSEVINDNIDLAFRMAELAVNDFAVEREEQMGALEFLLGLARDDVIKLERQEEQQFEAQIDLIQNQITKMEENQANVIELVSSGEEFTQAAIRGGVLLTDSPAIAFAKMRPHLATPNTNIPITPGNFPTTSRKNAAGEIIDPTPDDIRRFNELFSTFPPTTNADGFSAGFNGAPADPFAQFIQQKEQELQQTIAFPESFRAEFEEQQALANDIITQTAGQTVKGKSAGIQWLNQLVLNSPDATYEELFVAARVVAVDLSIADVNTFLKARGITPTKASSNSGGATLSDEEFLELLKTRE